MKYGYIIAFSLVFLFSCKSEFERIRTSNDPAAILKAANEYYDDEAWLRAQTLYDIVIPFYRGKVEAEELFYKYHQNRSSGDSLYTGMVVQVFGEIDKVESPDSSLIAIFVFEQGMFGDEGVRCVLLPAHHEKLKAYGPKDFIIIKGYCTGFNDTDVILEKSSIIEEE